MKAKEKTLRIISSGLSCSFTLDGGVTLKSIRDSIRGGLILSTPRPLFLLTARRVSDGEYLTVSSSEGWRECGYVTAGKTTVITVSGNEKLPGVTVVLCAERQENSRIEWAVDLQSSNKDYSLYECDYPAVSFDSNRNVEFMSPYGPGELWNSTDECSSNQSYPSYGASMQYMTFWNKVTRRGLYYGLHDPAPAYKRIRFSKKASDSFFTMKSSLPLTDIDRPCNSQPLAGRCVWQLYDGDWYDAALLYREFVTKYAVWMPEEGEHGRPDRPDWMKTADHWWRVRMGDDEKFVDDILRANEDLGYPSCTHLYDWHQIPFDNDYPHYFPVKPHFVTGVKRLKENGVKVMPYINGRLWDTRDKGMEDWQWSKLAEPNCTKDREGKPFIETYSSREADGEHVKLSIMCPSTACWQEKVSEIVSKLVNEYGVDAVYIDQISAAQPYMCEDRRHSHRPGGGTWWCESYNNLLDHVNRVLPEGTALSTECTADPFMKHLQAYLTWLWVHNRQVPAFVAVYSGYVTMFGRNYCFMPFEDDEGQRIMIAESLSFGEELGWNDPLLYLQMKHREFYRNCVHKRAEFGSFFYDGVMLRPPVIEDDRPVLHTEKCSQAYGGVVEHAAVFGSRWERKDGKKLLLLINASDTAAKAKVSMLDDGAYAFKGDFEFTARAVNGELTAELPPLSVGFAIYD